MIEHAIVSLFDPREDATALIEVSEPEHAFGELGGLRPIPFEVELVGVRRLLVTMFMRSTAPG